MMRVQSIFIISISLFLFSCSLVVKSKLKESNGSDDSGTEIDGLPEGDMEQEDPLGEDDVAQPDFNPEMCGIWGKINVPRPGEVDIGSSNPEMDGNGEMQFNILYPWLVWFINNIRYPEYNVMLSFNIGEDNFYCIHPEFLSNNGIYEGWITLFIYDAAFIPPATTNESLQFRSMIVDPVNFSIAPEALSNPSVVSKALSPLYWNGLPGERIDIDIERRVSRMDVEITFQGFPLTIDANRDARICISFIGMRDETYPFYDYEGLFLTELLGGTYFDLEDSEIESHLEPRVIHFPVNLDQKKRQEVFVHIKYVEARTVGTLAHACGDSTKAGSCVFDCITMGDSVGIEITSAYNLNAIGYGPPNSCEISGPDLCPD